MNIKNDSAIIIDNGIRSVDISIGKIIPVISAAMKITMAARINSSLFGECIISIFH